MRYRIKNSDGRYWDAESKRWESDLIGYTTYKTFGMAVSAGRRTKSTMFLAAEGKQVEEDK